MDSIFILSLSVDRMCGVGLLDTTFDSLRITAK